MPTHFNISRLLMVNTSKKQKHLIKVPEQIVTFGKDPPFWQQWRHSASDISLPISHNCMDIDFCQLSPIQLKTILILSASPLFTSESWLTLNVKFLPCSKLQLFHKRLYSHTLSFHFRSLPPRLFSHWFGNVADWQAEHSTLPKNLCMCVCVSAFL